MINIIAAWFGFLLGGISGAIPGLFFHRYDWLGGYTSWPRRLIRLGHISFFGIGFLNLGLGLTSQLLGIDSRAASILMLAGTVTMPLLCYASAFHPIFRRLFFIPAGSVLLSIILFIFSVDGASSSVKDENTSISSSLRTQEGHRASFNPNGAGCSIYIITERMVQS